MYIDAHCHLDFAVFDSDRDAVISQARRVGVSKFVVAGVDPKGWRRQRALVERLPGSIWSAGLHPVVCAEASEGERDEALRALPGCFEGPTPAMAVGETGLDRVFAAPDTLVHQTVAFRAHLALARALDRPVVLHVVGAHGAALNILRSEGLPDAGGMVHSFSGSREVALDYLRLGLNLSVSGAVLRTNATRLREAIQAIPKDRLLVETDAPDQPLKRGERNTPSELIRIAEAVGEVRGCDHEEILRDSAANCGRLFGMPVE